ncbi:hypothetical protein M885DRAFT_551077 [Pelagophyceae sp. CCMP2097]|nr:hypothetical protein M885DRAFT_551077 [Pelagophyceae sp. CCMP2097]|mmetsp:Transcript_28788/g.97029  ORF Transcript_28788/g.97029 Transcript_28788/m.97029 type:complete len:297 (-) Transcript_28788:68-958(-)
MAPTEDERRAAQRERQRVARERQASGAPTKNERKKRKRDGVTGAPDKAKSGDKKDASGKSAGAAWREKEYAGKGRNEFKKKRDVDPDALDRRVHDILIIPIFWRTHPGEEDAVCNEAERVKRLLLSASKDLDIWIDRTHKKSPGQKLAFWEDVGVTHRIELGPGDCKKKECVVSKSGGTGYSSATKVHDVSSTKRHVLLAALAKIGFTKCEAVEENGSLDLQNAAEAEAHLKKWLSGDDSKPQRNPPGGAPRPAKAPMVIDAFAKSANKKTFGNDDEQDDQQFAGADEDDSDDDDA